LIGRAADLARVKELLLRDGVRLLTLVGAAGAGKTRLALEVAGQTADAFDDGVWFVDLAPVRDPDLLPSAIAASLEVREDRDRPLIETLERHLAQRCALLLLDNFEQVLPAAAWLVNLLRGCPEVKLMVTSRSALHLQWEQEVAVQPLAVPDLAALPSPASLGQVASVALLLQRAQQIDPEFHLDDDNAREIAELCVRLDGLPLAIELAAARMRILPPRALLSRLSRGLAVLEGGNRDQPARQRTLHAALDWSYELLAPADKALFRRLSVFVGGFALEAVGEVCDPDGVLGIDPLRGVESLVEKSLVRPIRVAGAHEPRFRLLETIREYAVEHLELSGERETVRARHAHYYLGGAEVVFRQVSFAHQAAWLRNLELEHDNLRAALDWCRDAGQPELGLRAGGLLAWFWQVRGHISEGRARVTELLALADGSPNLRAEGLRIAGNLALSQFDNRAARAVLEESLALRRQLGDPAGLLGPLSSLGYTAMQQGDDATAQRCFDEALAIQRQLDDWVGIAESLNSLANLAHGRGDLARARALYEESQVINRRVGYRTDVVEHNLGVVAQEQGDLEAAREYLESSVATRRVLDDTPGLALSLAKLGEVIAAQGDLAGAHRALAESVVVQRDLGGRPQLTFVLERAAIVAAMHALPERALRLAGASSALREALGVPLDAAAQPTLDARLAPAWQALSPQVAEAAWQHGRALSVEDAISLVLEPVTPPVEPNPASGDSEASQLTPREREVATLVARGLTNRQIAATLVISERTADVHVSNILNKLTLNSRAQLAAWVVRHGLLE
jgi:predicted ATPase/DNA-binding CsgD family transcriptional regulator